MLVPERFHHVNSVFCSAFGFLLNGALLVLLASRHTTADMATLRNILTLTSLIDLACLAAFSLFQPVVLAQGGYTAGFLIGPLWWLPQPYSFLLTTLSFVLYVFHNNALSMVYIVRYLIVCRSKKYSLPKFLAMSTIPLVLALGWALVLAKTGYVSTPKEQLEANLRFFFNETSATSQSFSRMSASVMSGGNSSDLQFEPRYVIAYFRRPGNNAVARCLLVYPIVNYSLIAYFGWRIYRHLTTMAVGHLSGQEYRALQLQLSSTLLLQSLAPLVVSFVPSVALGAAAAFGLRAQNISAYYTAFLSWELVVNPLIVIWVIRAYRRVIFGWLPQPKRVFLFLFSWRRRGRRTADIHEAIQAAAAASAATQRHSGTHAQLRGRRSHAVQFAVNTPQKGEPLQQQQSSTNTSSSSSSTIHTRCRPHYRASIALSSLRSPSIPGMILNDDEDVVVTTNKATKF